MKVDVYVDVVCPWSYLGKRRLETALAGYAERDSVEVEYKPFPLSDGVLSVGPDDVPGAVKDHVTTVAAQDGVTLDLAAVVPAPTFDAHRLIWWARAHGRQHQVAERLFAAHLSDGVDLGDRSALAAASGLEGAAEFLASDAGVEEVKEAIGEARAMGVESVPTFVFEERWAVTGAQPAGVLGEILDQVADQSIAVRAGGGECCGGGCCN